MEKLPNILSAEELRTLDVAGLIEQLALAQQALELLQDQKQLKYTELITAQNTLLEAQKVTHKLKINIKDLTNNSSKFLERINIKDLTNNSQKFLERIKIIKTMVRAEK